jgi:protein-tyrosine phosphatase
MKKTFQHQGVKGCMLIRLKRALPPGFKRKVRLAFQGGRESIAYRLSRQQQELGDLRHLIFVCKGNICRSAFAEYYLKGLVPQGRVKIESCGLDVDQGVFSPPEAIKVGREFGLDLSRHRSKGLTVCDLLGADLILPMEYRQYLRLVAMFPEYGAKIKMLRDFSPWPSRLLCNINDPFGWGEDEFRSCFGLMQICLEGLHGRLPIAERLG